jgi:hypothetical protein
METTKQHTFTDLSQIDVGDHIEKKGNLSYLSWAWAVSEVLKRDNSATWEFRWQNDVPFVRVGDTAMVFCTIKAFGVERTAFLPIMDSRNRPIANPDSFALNSAMQRCLTKAIAHLGIGLYIYAGEDLPPADPVVIAAQEKATEEAKQQRISAIHAEMRKATTIEELGAVWRGLSGEEQKWTEPFKNALKETLLATTSSEPKSGSKSGKGSSPAPRSGKHSDSPAVGSVPTAA